MSLIASTPKPPYYAVIFTSLRKDGEQGYSAMADKMLGIASKQEGFIGVESARENIGITISYWSDLSSIKKWKEHIDHQEAQQLGHEKWYSSFRVRITKVEREYGV